ncbi:MAPEG family protein [Novosphingobium mangrovi (ex Huang et al. 2023)]|uniref:MAPEG family protein n=1 Tax=Novosphingobium mangrovi (ex Huang et al. 2023) TaxID=2976432 RepID=A0ABT2I3S0_9SPHN|nr:MAPEG family protein [Novosphingobium mangrovi (ex Huang et al. 2023)]MCT2399454.1 MAPEG family protein [Novosphingobium mangrovi (ex Huang et al. 2023)]
MILQTTLSLAAAAAVINVWLAFRAGKLRYNAKILHGDGGNPMLMQRMRAQANFVENTPFVLILVAAIEMTGKGGTWLAVVGSVYMLARVSHAFGMDNAGPNPFRAVGFLVTALTLVGLSAMAVLIALGRF